MKKCKDCKNLLGYNAENWKLGCLREHGSKFDRLNPNKIIYYDAGKEPDGCPFFEKRTSENSFLHSILFGVDTSTKMDILIKKDKFKII